MVKSRVGAYSSSNKGSGAGASFVGTSSSSIQHAGSPITSALKDSTIRRGGGQKAS